MKDAEATMRSEHGRTTAEAMPGDGELVTAWTSIDQACIDGFAACTGDRQWIHVDVERARRESPSGTTLAHGFLVLALVGRFSFEVGLFPAAARQVLNYGLERVRFVAPVPAGARVRDRVTLLSTEEKGPGQRLFRARHTIEIEGQAKPALVAESLVLVLL